MKFSLGDKIVLKRTGDEGHIIAFISATMMEVEVAGTQFPVYADEVDHPYLRWFTEKKKPAPRKPAEAPIAPLEKSPPKRLARGIYLSFLPQFRPDDMEDIVDDFRIHLLNETPSPILFTYDVRDAAGASVFYHSAALHPFGNIYLHRISLQDMNAQPRFHWTLAEDSKKAKKTPPLTGTLRIRPARLFEHIHTLLLHNEPAFSYLLAEDATLVIKPLPNAPELAAVGQYSVAVTMPQKGTVDTDWQPRAELDLHIERLTPHGPDMSNAEIMQLQMHVLHYHLTMAIAHGQQRLIIIHGLGKGILKEEVHKMLHGMAGIASFTSAWNGRYGYGATEVVFG